MEKAKFFADMVKNLTLLTQLGLSLITPLMMCLGICWWLCTHFGLGGWIFIPGFFFGLGGSFSVALKLYHLTIQKDQKEKQEKKKPLGYNRHI